MLNSLKSWEWTIGRVLGGGSAQIRGWSLRLPRGSAGLIAVWHSPSGGPTLSTHFSPRSPPRPSPGSLHYSDEDVTKYNDLIPAESSSLTEKPSEVSDSQVTTRGCPWGWGPWRGWTVLGASPLPSAHHDDAGPGAHLGKGTPVILSYPVLLFRQQHPPWVRGTEPERSWHSPQPVCSPQPQGCRGQGTGGQRGWGLSRCPVAGGNGGGSANPTKWHLCLLPEKRAAVAGQERGRGQLLRQAAPGEAMGALPPGWMLGGI